MQDKIHFVPKKNLFVKIICKSDKNMLKYNKKVFLQKTDECEVKIMIHIAIVEDEKSYSDNLKEYLLQYERESGEAIKISLFSDGDEIIRNYHSQFDIIFMDVEMKFMDGMSAAEEIRKSDTEVVIIFVTNMPQYAIKGYAVEAFDYLLKPVSYFAFSRCLSRAIARKKNRMKKPLILNVRGGTVRVDAENIYYVESNGHNMIYHTTQGDYEAVATMKEIEESLAGMHFFRASKWYLINLTHVEGFQDGYARLSGTSLVVSRAKRKDFLEALTAYWGEVIK